MVLYITEHVIGITGRQRCPILYTLPIFMSHDSLAPSVDVIWNWGKCCCLFPNMHYTTTVYRSDFRRASGRLFLKYCSRDASLIYRETTEAHDTGGHIQFFNDLSGVVEEFNAASLLWFIDYHYLFAPGHFVLFYSLWGVHFFYWISKNIYCIYVGFFGLLVSG